VTVKRLSQNGFIIKPYMTKMADSLMEPLLEALCKKHIVWLTYTQLIYFSKYSTLKIRQSRWSGKTYYLSFCKSFRMRSASLSQPYYIKTMIDQDNTQCFIAVPIHLITLSLKVIVVWTSYQSSSIFYHLSNID
jgi:hypothetical protein